MKKTCTLETSSAHPLSFASSDCIQVFQHGRAEDEHKQGINRVLLLDGEKASIVGRRNVCKEVTFKPDSAREPEI